MGGCLATDCKQTASERVTTKYRRDWTEYLALTPQDESQLSREPIRGGKRSNEKNHDRFLSGLPLQALRCRFQAQNRHRSTPPSLTQGLRHVDVQSAQHRKLTPRQGAL